MYFNHINLMTQYYGFSSEQTGVTYKMHSHSCLEEQLLDCHVYFRTDYALQQL